MLGIRPAVVAREAVLAVALTVGLELEYLHRLSAAEAALVLLITLPLVLRLAVPLVVLGVVLVGIVVQSWLGGVAGPDFPVVPVVALVVALYAVGSRTSWPRTFVAGALTVVAWVLATQLTEPRGSVLLGVLVTACGLLIGRAMSALRFESDAFAKQALALQEESDELGRQAIVDERRRIARELHDVIGHSISVMGVQAAAVRSVLREDQVRERDALLAVERVGREAVAEMSRVLGLLRADLPEVDSPTPKLSRVGELVADLRHAGLHIQLAVDGDLSQVPAGVDLAGYRILQEALTNVLKHAPAAQVAASVSCAAGWLDLWVVDDGAGSTDGRLHDRGRGLVGMRERTALYGGELLARPVAEGGFEVRARLPLRAVS